MDTKTNYSEDRLFEAISRGKHHWEQTVDVIDDIITIMDADLRILRANRAAHRLFGYELGQLVGRKCHHVFQHRPEPCPRCPVTIPGADRQTRRDLVQNRLLNKTFDLASTRIHDQDGAVQMIVHVARDVTDTIYQEEERKRLSTAIEQTTEVVVITDTGGTILYVNPAFTETTGYFREEALGRNMNLVKSGNQNDSFYRHLWNTILAGQVWQGRLVNRKKDGTLFSEMSTISPIFNADKSISAFVAVKRDISREEQLERQLRQAVKLEAIGTLAGGIAHDFNNILSAILGYGQIAKSQLADQDPLNHPLDQILTAGNRAAELVDQILTFSRQDQGREPFRPLKVQVIIKEALKLLRSTIPTTIKLNHRIDNDCPPIMADASQIHQVIMNLCTNARQAIEAEHGDIVVTLTTVEQNDAGQQVHPSLSPGRYLHLTVSDSGCGMDERQLQRIFDPFFTTKPKDRGTGLGLAVVHGIVKSHHGEISVVSTLGTGTSFDVFLPAASEPAEPVERPVKAVRGGSERILLVDDELLLIEYLTMVLERFGYRVTAFADSLEAVDCFRRNSNEFDLVITDMTMPNMTGAELAQEVLALRPYLPVLLVTGYHEQINRDKALRIGISGFLNKPLRKNDLARTIREMLDHGLNSDHR